MLLDVAVDGRPVKAIFSGDTIIDRDHWGDQSLMYVGGKLALSLAEEFPSVALYWFLISAGYKTYRFLPVFFREFFPCCHAPTPPHVEEVIDALALAKFGGRYDGSVIRADNSQYRLREGVADLTDERLRDPHVKFFVEQNQGTRSAMSYAPSPGCRETILALRHCECCGGRRTPANLADDPRQHVGRIRCSRRTRPRSLVGRRYRFSRQCGHRNCRSTSLPQLSHPVGIRRKSSRRRS